MGNNILKQGFDDLDSVGIFEKACKGEIYYNNVNDDDEIITEDEVKEKDKTTSRWNFHLPNLKNGKFESIQQE